MTERDETPRTDTSTGYDSLAERADEDLDRQGSPWGDSFFQEHYSWPATRAMLPDVTGDEVLIAGCGRGDHVEWFLENGATVVGIDASERAIETARERFGDEADFRHADVSDPLDFEADSFDLVFSHLMLGHLEAWSPVFDEFHRVLTERGTLAFTVIHPQYLRETRDITNHYATQRIVVQWPGAEIPAYYRPMSGIVGPLLESAFRLESFEEPKPRESFRTHSPDRYRAAMRSPQVLCVRGRVVSKE
ncbi:class I SAM-dependent methyltransferase [Halorussus halophilus]|uniref:class I SAM-dependent methyltransferase n=1 Tax=Halorussus halophilus TaxID=2650975 RepID=UPI0013012C9F|nr:class I SAM-dependent methyltransferase [Halorussus halophilus]